MRQLFCTRLERPGRKTVRLIISEKSQEKAREKNSRKLLDNICLFPTFASHKFSVHHKDTSAPSDAAQSSEQMHETMAGMSASKMYPNCGAIAYQLSGVDYQCLTWSESSRWEPAGRRMNSLFGNGAFPLGDSSSCVGLDTLEF